MKASVSPLSRRRCLKLLGLGAAGLGANLALPPRFARAADYKALVCVFLFGGNDGINTIVPRDDARYRGYAAVRGELAIAADRLVPLAGSNDGLHPSLAALVPAWEAGEMATVFNVGPLDAPLTKAQVRDAVAAGVRLPDSLFSHSDQQRLWQTGSVSALERSGWGGRAAEALATANPVISVGENGLFGLSTAQPPLVLPRPGADFGARELADEPRRRNEAALRLRASTLRALYDGPQDGDIAAVYAGMQRDAFAVSERLAAIVAATPGSADGWPAIDAAFAPLIDGRQIRTDLGRQLYQVAKLIAANGRVGGSRQIFFAQLDGFDTHGDQLALHADLLQQVGDALACFRAATAAIGLGDAVTTFTQSDFGRTFVPNNSLGTDHGWGNHQIVVGGAVRGGRSYGRFPELEPGGPDDVGADARDGQGRWIPTLSVSQYASTLLRWFGADDAAVARIVPGIGAFEQRSIGFV